MNPSSVSFGAGSSGSCQNYNGNGLKSNKQNNNIDQVNSEFVYPVTPISQHMPFSVVVDDVRSHCALGGELAVIENKVPVDKADETVGKCDTKSDRCLSKELFTCLALSSIVIGLPIAIIIVLINLPKLSTRRDTRQQHYVLLAFGFPFSLVVIVSIIYAIFRLVMRIRTGPDHSKLLRSRMSWRRFSRRLRRGLNQPSNSHHHNHRHHRHHHSPYYLHGHSQHSPPYPEQSSLPERSSIHNIDIEDRYSDDSLGSSRTTIDTEPKLYSLVAEIIAKQQQQEQHQNLDHYRKYSEMSEREYNQLSSPQSIHRVYSKNSCNSLNPSSLSDYQQQQHCYPDDYPIHFSVPPLPPSPPLHQCNSPINRHSLTPELRSN